MTPGQTLRALKTHREAHNLNATMFAVMFEVADRDGSGKGCYARTKTLGNACRVHHKTVGECLRKLVEIGVLSKLDDGPGRPKLYRFNPPNRESHTPTSSEKTPPNRESETPTSTTKNDRNRESDAPTRWESDAPRVESQTPGVGVSDSTLQNELYERTTSTSTPPNPPKTDSTEKRTEIDAHNARQNHVDLLGDPYEEIGLTPESVVNLYNRLCPSLKRTKGDIGNKRRKALEAAITAHPDPDWWRAYFEQAESIPFLRGENDSDWVAYIDYLLRPAKVQMVEEDNYPKPKQSKSVTRAKEIAKRPGVSKASRRLQQQQPNP